MKKSILFQSLVLVALLQSGSALGSSVEEMRYGSAGCGLGAAIFGSGEGFSQVLAVTTNDIWYTQIFGITSGTSNCTPHAGSKNASAFLNQFLEINNVAFAEDVVRGHGEALTVIAGELGCQDVDRFGTSLQAHFAEIYPDHTVRGGAASRNLIGVLQQPDLKGQCSVKI